MGSWVWRVLDRNAVYLSQEWYRIYGFDPADGPPVWEKRFERVHPEDRLKWKGTIERAIVEKADYEVEFRIVIPSGKVKWIHTVGHPVLSNTGDLEQFLGSSTDITECKSAEQEREKLREDLAHVNRLSMLGELTASISHELKQPIAATITNANTSLLWLQRDQPDLDEACQAAEKIVEAFTSAQLDLALGRLNVVHAALLAGRASEAFLVRWRFLEDFRADEPV